MKTLQPAIRKYAFVIIAIIGIIAYANSLNNEFQFDDGYHIVEGQKIKNMENVLKLSHWKVFENRPLSFFTLAVNYKLGELDVTGYHIFNLLVHILSGFMAFLLSLQILSLGMFRQNKTISDNKVLIALFTAFIFIAHPIQTQAVTYIIQRMSVLAGFFYMFAVWLYIKGRRAHIEEPGAQSWVPYPFYIGAFLAGFLGILSKQNAASFPLAFILVEVMFIRTPQLKIDKKFLLIISIAVAAVIIAGVMRVGLPVEFDRISRSEYLFTQFRVLVKYWQLLFLPVNQHLDYYWTISTSLWGTKELLSLAFLLGTIGLAIFLIRKKLMIPAFAVFWFYLTLSVESSIIPIRDVIFEHRLYPAVLGFGFAISYLAFHYLSPKKQNYPLIILSVITVVYIGLSIHRNNIWENSYTLWSDSVKKSPKRERSWYWLASYYTSQRDMESAMNAYNTSIENNPRFPLAYSGRGNLKKEMGDVKGAIQDYDKAIQLDPRYGTAYYNRGIALSSEGKVTEAIKSYDKAIESGTRTAAVYYNRGNAKRRKGDYKSAIDDYNTAVKIDPRYPLAYYNRGLTYAAMKDHQTALIDIERAIRIDPKNHLFYNGKGVSQIELDQIDEAINNFNMSIQLNPNFGQAYFNRGYAKFNGMGDLEGACNDWKISSSKGYRMADSYLKNHCK